MQQLDLFYNTTRETGKKLRERKRSAFSQTAIVLKFFRQNPGKEFTPPEVMEQIGDEKLQVLNSVRRAITNLTTAGHLEKTDTKRKGIYGENNYCWKLKAEA